MNRPVMCGLWVCVVACGSAPSPSATTLCGRGAPQHFREMDADADGVVTEQEWLRQRGERFDRADADHDGTVTPAERRRAFEQRRADKGERPACPASDRIAERDDATAGESVARADAQARAKERFAALDRDADGKLTQRELEAAHRGRTAHGRGATP